MYHCRLQTILFPSERYNLVRSINEFKSLFQLLYLIGFFFNIIFALLTTSCFFHFLYLFFINIYFYFIIYYCSLFFHIFLFLCVHLLNVIISSSIITHWGFYQRSYNSKTLQYSLICLSFLGKFSFRPSS